MKPISDATRKILVLSQLPGVGPATLNALLKQPGFGTVELESLPWAPPPVLRALDDSDTAVRAEERASTLVAAARADGAQILSPLDEEYPALLAETPDRPPVLFVKGDLGPTRARALCVIGTREPTRHGAIIAERLTSYYAGQGWSIVSGLALGTDAIAHRAALNAGGHTVAVLAHGLDTVAPKSHTPLAQEILDKGGALITEYPYGTRPYGPQFVKRDRIQAGLAAAVVLIQTDMRGGSLHASRAALEYGRVLAYPAPTEQDVAREEPKVQGVLLIERGAPAEVAEFLRCKPAALSRVRPLRSRDDYRVLEDALLESEPPEREEPPLVLF
jgi:DNA processing protein